MEKLLIKNHQRWGIHSMKRNDIVIGKTYHNGKEGRFYTERQVVEIKPQFKDDLVKFKTVKGVISDYEKYCCYKGQCDLKSFANWAKGVVEKETL